MHPGDCVVQCYLAWIYSGIVSQEVQLTTASVETVDPRKREDLKKELKIRLANATNKKVG